MTRTFLLRTIFLGLAVSACAFAMPASAQKAKEQAVLLGQFGDWGAYKATPNGKTVCFALSKPIKGETDPPGRNRDPAYAFVSTRPAEKVKNEVSIIVGYPQKPNADATITVDGNARYSLYTQDDGAWVKNAAEEPQLVQAMRKGAQMVVRSVSTHNTKTTDTYSLKGISDALDKVASACK
jgi:invasion protein IalB